MKQNNRHYKFSEVLTIINGRNQRKVEDVNGCFPIYGSGGIMGWANDFICPENTIVIGRKGSINNPIFVNQKFWNVDTAFGLVANPSLLLPKYLYYFCVSFNFEALNTTVTIPSLTKANLLNVDIPVPSIKEQEEIVSLLDHLVSLSNTRRIQLQKLDALASSRFVEMFGDSNTAMQKWPIHQIQDVAEVTVGVVIQPTRFYVESPGVKAFRSLNIGAGFIKDDKWVYFSKEAHALNQKSALHTGDVVIVRSGHPGTSCVITDEYDNSNAIDIIIAHPKKEIINPVFLAYFNNLPHGQEQIVNKTGGAAQQHFNVGAYKKVRIPNVPIKLQNEFAAFIKQLDKSKVVGKMQRISLEKIAHGDILSWRLALP